MKQNTPIQELIEFIESEIKDLEQSDAIEDKDTSNYLYACILSTTNKLLEKEKQAIIEAFDKGIEEAGHRINAAMNMGQWEDKNAEDYFNNKYNTK